MSQISIENLLSTGERVPPPAGVAAWASIRDRAAWNAELTADPMAFWKQCGERLAWETPPRTTFAGELGDGRWFFGGRLNATVSCLDRHVATHPDAVAYIYLREDGLERSMTYAELLTEVSRLGNALRDDGVKAGDRVCIYMPLSLEGIVAMLACA
ncbi:MAG: AMP-binding protein, partial [Candidatus Eremiobacteraeota bacterium]|nr:AMP-binding protein [Candidatus Eremiobacteraeota bacterium]